MIWKVAVLALATIVVALALQVRRIRSSISHLALGGVKNTNAIMSNTRALGNLRRIQMHMLGISEEDLEEKTEKERQNANVEENEKNVVD